MIQFEIRVDGSRSLKDKRRVVSSLKDRLRREHRVSVAEVDGLESHTRATLGVAMAASDTRVCQSSMDRVLNMIRVGRDYEVTDHKLEILTGR